MADRTPEAVGAAAGEALAATFSRALEAAVTPLVIALQAVQADQAEAREALYALAQRVEALEPRGTARRRD